MQSQCKVGQRCEFSPGDANDVNWATRLPPMYVIQINLILRGSLKILSGEFLCQDLIDTYDWRHSLSHNVFYLRKLLKKQMIP